MWAERFASQVLKRLQTLYRLVAVAVAGMGGAFAAGVVTTILWQRRYARRDKRGPAGSGGTR